MNGVPRPCSTYSPPTTETGTATSATAAARQLRSRPPISSAIAARPSSATQPRLPSAERMNDSGRNASVSTVIPDSPGDSAASAASTSAVTCAVSASGSLSITSRMFSAPFTDASPISGWWSSTTSATSPIRVEPPATATPASASAVVIGETCCTLSRWFGVSTKPPVPGVDASTKLSGETHKALPVVSISWVSVTSLAFNLAGSTCTCSCRSRWPQIDTFATPGMPSSRGRICHRASTDISIGETVDDDRPIIETRLTDERGSTITGGVPTPGRACAWVIRSCTTCRAWYTSVPGSNTSWIEDSPGIDREVIRCTHGTPFSRSCSIGTVISCSTSAADRPSASACTSTVVAANSG